MQKLKEFTTTKPALQQKLEEILWKKKKQKAPTRNKKSMEGECADKSKHTIKVGNHPHKAKEGC